MALRCTNTLVTRTRMLGIETMFVMTELERLTIRLFGYVVDMNLTALGRLCELIGRKRRRLCAGRRRCRIKVLEALSNGCLSNE